MHQRTDEILIPIHFVTQRKISKKATQPFNKFGTFNSINLNHKKVKKILIILLFTSVLCQGQSRDVGPGSSMLANNIDHFAVQRIDKVYNNEYSDKTTGSVYLFEEWETCVIRTNLKEGGLNLSAPCNYNLLSDTFEMKIGDELYFLKKDAIVEIIKRTQSFVPNPNMTTDGSRNYMEVLAEGDNLDLVRMYSARIKDVQSSTSLGLYEKKIRKQDDLYFFNENNILIEVPKSKRKIYKILDLDKEERKQIKGNIKDTENLAQAVQLAG